MASPLPGLGKGGSKKLKLTIPKPKVSSSSDDLARAEKASATMRKRIAGAGVEDPTKKKGVTGLERLMGIADVPRTALGGTFHNLMAEATLGKRVDVGAEVQKAIAGKPHVMAADTLKLAGVTNKYAQFGLGFLFDVLLDPVTYIGAGTHQAARGAADNFAAALLKMDVASPEFLSKIDDLAKLGGLDVVKWQDDIARLISKGTWEVTSPDFQRAVRSALRTVASQQLGRQQGIKFMGQTILPVQRELEAVGSAGAKLWQKLPGSRGLTGAFVTPLRAQYMGEGRVLQAAATRIDELVAAGKLSASDAAALQWGSKIKSSMDDDEASAVSIAMSKATQEYRDRAAPEFERVQQADARATQWLKELFRRSGVKEADLEEHDDWFKAALDKIDEFSREVETKKVDLTDAQREVKGGTAFLKKGYGEDQVVIQGGPVPGVVPTGELTPADMARTSAGGGVPRKVVEAESDIPAVSDETDETVAKLMEAIRRRLQESGNFGNEVNRAGIQTKVGFTINGEPVKKGLPRDRKYEDLVDAYERGELGIDDLIEYEEEVLKPKIEAAFQEWLDANPQAWSLDLDIDSVLDGIIARVEGRRGLAAWAAWLDAPDAAVGRTGQRMAMDRGALPSGSVRDIIKDEEFLAEWEDYLDSIWNSERELVRLYRQLRLERMRGTTRGPARYGMGVRAPTAVRKAAREIEKLARRLGIDTRKLRGMNSAAERVMAYQAMADDARVAIGELQMQLLSDPAYFSRLKAALLEEGVLPQRADEIVAVVRDEIEKAVTYAIEAERAAGKPQRSLLGIGRTRAVRPGATELEPGAPVKATEFLGTEYPSRTQRVGRTVVEDWETPPPTTTTATGGPPTTPTAGGDAEARMSELWDMAGDTALPESERETAYKEWMQLYDEVNGIKREGSYSLIPEPKPEAPDVEAAKRATDYIVIEKPFVWRRDMWGTDDYNELFDEVLGIRDVNRYAQGKGVHAVDLDGALGDDVGRGLFAENWDTVKDVKLVFLTDAEASVYFPGPETVAAYDIENHVIWYAPGRFTPMRPHEDPLTAIVHEGWHYIQDMRGDDLSTVAGRINEAWDVSTRTPLHDAEIEAEGAIAEAVQRLEQQLTKQPPVTPTAATAGKVYPPGRLGDDNPTTLKTGMVWYDDIAGNKPFHDSRYETVQDYYRDAKGRVGQFVEMSPDEYLSRVAALRGQGAIDFRLESAQDVIDEYAERMLAGEKAPALMLDYHGTYETPDKILLGQEGIHRALAAKQAGFNKVNVALVTQYPPGEAESFGVAGIKLAPKPKPTTWTATEGGEQVTKTAAEEVADGLPIDSNPVPIKDFFDPESGYYQTNKGYYGRTKVWRASDGSLWMYAPVQRHLKDTPYLARNVEQVIPHIRDGKIIGFSGGSHRLGGTAQSVDEAVDVAERAIAGQVDDPYALHWYVTWANPVERERDFLTESTKAHIAAGTVPTDDEAIRNPAGWMIARYEQLRAEAGLPEYQRVFDPKDFQAENRAWAPYGKLESQVQREFGELWARTPKPKSAKIPKPKKGPAQTTIFGEEVPQGVVAGKADEVQGALFAPTVEARPQEQLPDLTYGGTVEQPSLIPEPKPYHEMTDAELVAHQAQVGAASKAKGDAWRLEKLRTDADYQNAWVKWKQDEILAAEPTLDPNKARVRAQKQLQELLSQPKGAAAGVDIPLNPAQEKWVAKALKDRKVKKFGITEAELRAYVMSIDDPQPGHLSSLYTAPISGQQPGPEDIRNQAARNLAKLLGEAPTPKAAPKRAWGEQVYMPGVPEPNVTVPETPRTLGGRVVDQGIGKEYDSTPWEPELAAQLTDDEKAILANVYDKNAVGPYHETLDGWFLPDPRRVGPGETLEEYITRQEHLYAYWSGKKMDKRNHEIMLKNWTEDWQKATGAGPIEEAVPPAVEATPEFDMARDIVLNVELPKKPPATWQEAIAHNLPKEQADVDLFDLIDDVTESYGVKQVKTRKGKPYETISRAWTVDDASEEVRRALGGEVGARAPRYVKNVSLNQARIAKTFKSMDTLRELVAERADELGRADLHFDDVNDFLVALEETATRRAAGAPDPLQVAQEFADNQSIEALGILYGMALKADEAGDTAGKTAYMKLADELYAWLERPEEDVLEAAGAAIKAGGLPGPELQPAPGLIPQNVKNLEQRLVEEAPEVPAGPAALRTRTEEDLVEIPWEADTPLNRLKPRPITQEVEVGREPDILRPTYGPGLDFEETGIPLGRGYLPNMQRAEMSPLRAMLRRRRHGGAADVSEIAYLRHGVSPEEIERPVERGSRALSGYQSPSMRVFRREYSPEGRIAARMDTELDPAILTARRIQEAGKVESMAYLEDSFVRNAGRRIESPDELFTNEELYTVMRDGIPELWAVPPKRAAAFNRAKTVFTDDEVMKGFLGNYDRVLNFWKRMATNWNPGFHGRNAMSNYFLLFTEGIEDPEGVYQGMRLVNLDMAGKLDVDEIIDLGKGGKISAGELMDEMRDLSVRTGAFLKNEAGLQMEQSIRWAGSPTRFLNPTYMGGKAGEFIEDGFRVGGYINARRQGLDPESAASLVIAAMYSYSPLFQTAFERDILRRIVPFQRWLVQNTKHMVDVLLHAPGRVTWLGKLQGEGRSTTESDWDVMPDWMRDLYPIPTPLKDKFGNEIFFNPNMPIQDIQKLDLFREGKFDAKDILSSLSPVVKTPAELVLNVDFYYGDQIESYPGQLRRAPGYIEAFDDLVHQLPGFTGVAEEWDQFKEAFRIYEKTDERTGDVYLQMPAKAAKALRDLSPWLANVGKLMDDQRRTPYDRVAIMTGLKAFPYEEDILTEQQTYADLEELRNTITRLKAEGKLPETTSTAKPPKGPTIKLTPKQKKKGPNLKVGK